MCNTGTVNADQAARELLRAIRGSRSQVAFARKLGYKGNPIADWEAGRRSPVASELLRACRVGGIDVDAAFARFHPGAAPALGDAGDDGVARWLDALRGGNPIGDVAARAGLSRFQVGRFLAGETRPRAPDFLVLVQALTGRMSDLVAELVPIASVPALEAEHTARTASRRLAFDEPWTEAVLRVLETTAYAALPAHLPGWLADRLGIDGATEVRCLEKLVAAGVLRWSGDRYVSAGPLTVDTRARPEVVLLKAHWAGVALARMKAPIDGDRFSYNAFSVSKADLDRIRELHLAYFREVRGIVAASEPPEVVALINVQLMSWTLD
jgi:hypothetical protein